MSLTHESLEAGVTIEQEEMVLHSLHPLNAGIAPEVAREKFITPQKRFFIRSHGSIPDVDGETYRLSVSGRVKVPLELSLDDLRIEFASSSVVATLQCAGHRRSELAAVQPIRGEVAWDADAISTAEWRGVRLREVLLAAGIGPGVKHVAFLGLDEIEKGGERFGFGASIPLEKALSGEVLLAYEMNGEPLTREHGFPLRVVVPGYIGARSVKWLGGIRLQASPSNNYFQRHAYKLFPPDTQAADANWEEGKVLSDLAINTVICRPRASEVLPAGPVTIQGYAITGEGAHIEAVELSLNGGATWREATLLERPHPWTWCFWEASFQLEPGCYEIVARAWDSRGRTQPANLREVWNFKGYMNNAWHRLHVSVF
ncbi:MAG TPA: molybdopterin-dependent oxidoreductase [Ktedonobacteraceae bacterium]|nr:molybdopterin-dependent oxidoreductase [Ktedonobacteraceae bacterium]